ncbi:MAG: glycosyltransferase, partial [Candidatus Eisenbacteria bacterium]|nr:glycosyltransferase [Candidatus Eisenbacteria bacterium]
LEPDLVHSSTLPGDLAARVGFRGREPWVSVKVSVDTWMPAAVRFVDRLVTGRADVVYAVADEVAAAKSFLGRPGMLPLVIPNPPMIPFADGEPRGLPETTPVRLLCIGRLERVKRVGDFLLMAGALERSHPGRFAFSVVGDGRQLDELRAQASSLGIADAVEFRCAVSDVASEIDAADIVLLFSAGEGSPNAVLETIARGRVPVARRAAGTTGTVPSVLGPCLVDSASPEAFAERVLDIVARPDDYLSRVHEARSSLRRRSDHFESAMERLYQGVLSRGGGDGRIRVLHLITRLIVGGAQENTIASVQRVNPERYDSHLWCGPQIGSEGSLFQDARDRGELPRVVTNLVREIRPLRDLAVVVQLARLMRRERFDIVHTHCSKAGIVGRVAAKLAGVPHIIHSLHGWAFHDRMNSIVRRVYVASESMMEPWTRPLVSVSKQTTKDGLEAGIGAPENYRLIRSGIPLDRFRADKARGRAVRAQLGINENDIVIGSVGRLAPQKNPMDFVKIAELLLARHTNLTFLYVGDGPMRESIEAATAARGIAESVRLLGVRDDVPDLLRAMDVFILTSLWEGLPRVVLQALATGLPVVAYNTAGIAEAVVQERNGFLVARGAVDETVELLDRLINDPIARAEMGRTAADDFDPAFSEDGMISDLERLY